MGFLPDIRRVLRHLPVKRCVKTSHLRKMPITLLKQFHQLNTRGQMLGVIRTETMPIHELIGEALQALTQRIERDCHNRRRHKREYDVGLTARPDERTDADHE